MKFTGPIFLLSAMLSSTVLAQTIQLPQLPDGTYLISIGEDGKQTYTEITASVNATNNAPTPGISSSARLGKRFNWPSNTYPWCPGGDWFLQDDFYNHGWDAFYASCADGGDHKFPAGTTLANYQGTSVSYMCSYTANPCRPDEWVDAVNWAASNCHGRSNGWMEPAYLHVPAWNKRYGYAKVGSSIC
ncbi:hypothetical protein QBC35DRAFT_98188 [Podospora australis]|uniref:Uncharacterized protein n=1 Tax=Podospora australis TaxID=1536484 RepID=A0AAN6WLB9_9PEZI|nr:hypothetical protein QBC35DRAFT_98188 [Podospora australis]